MRNFKDILDGNIITDLTNDPEMKNKYNANEKTVIQMLYEEQYQLLQKKRFDLEDEKVLPAFGDTDLSKNPKEIVLKGDDPNVFLTQLEIDRKEMDQNMIEIAAEKEVLAKMRADFDAMVATKTKEIEDTISKARTDADAMLKNSREQGHKAGYDAGYDEGYTKGKTRIVKEHADLLENGTIAFFKELEGILKNVEDIQFELVQSNIEQMKEVSLSVAEKIVQVSLQSSGEVIRKMITNATDKILSKEWAKIYISKLDASMLLQINVDLMKELAHISPHLQIETIDNATHGTCIIELPDQMIDASVNTQFDKIKDVISSYNYANNPQN